MKIAITGKGGTGKTTFAAILARLYADEKKNVFAIDVDPDSNLGLALGFDINTLNSITPISKIENLIKERTGTNIKNSFIRINPYVNDIPDIYSKKVNGVKLLVLGTIKAGGEGCICPEHIILRRIINNLILYRNDIVIMDMEAGLEHLGRGTAKSVDLLIVVIEPGSRSIQTYNNIKRLSKDLNIKQVCVIANKIINKYDKKFIINNIPCNDFLGFISYDKNIIYADRCCKSPYDFSTIVKNEIINIKNIIDKKYGGKIN